MPSAVRITDGQVSFINGVDSGRTPTVASTSYPEGLSRQSLAWTVNATVRGGGITSRYGWKKIVEGAPWSGLYQGGFMYEPDGSDPCLVLSIGGRIFRVHTETDNSVDEIGIPGDPNPAFEPQAFMEQAERFLIIQAGDYTTNPLFWDGASMRRSNGLTGITTIGDPNISELPPAGPMDYYMGRLWYAIGRTYTAGDIVQGAAGTAAYELRDSVLKVTENPFAVGGDGFIVPSQAGNIRALEHTANLDTALGVGPLYVCTRRAIYSSNPPVSRMDWIASTTSANYPPLQTVAQNRFGPYGDRSVVSVNGDLFYQSSDGIRSLFIAQRYFQQWGNTALSRNVNRAILYNDRALMRYSSGIEFDNRILQTCIPVQTPSGVVFRGIIPLDFDLISSFGKKEPPAWEGILEGLDILQLFEADFGGLQRAFAVVVSQVSGEIEIWELTLSERFEEGDRRITWVVETPAYTWDRMFELKRLNGLELWIDRLWGKVEFKVEYREDQNPCWHLWHVWDECAVRNSCEDEDVTECNYPTTDYCEQFRSNMVLPEPPVETVRVGEVRPSNIGYQFQVRITVKGFCRIRGILVHAIPVDQSPFDGMVC